MAYIYWILRVSSALGPTVVTVHSISIRAGCPLGKLDTLALVENVGLTLCYQC